MKNSTQTFLGVALIYLASIYVAIIVVDYENDNATLHNRIEQLEDKIESDSCLIERLEHNLDSIQKRYRILESEPGIEFMNVLNAIMQVESSGRDDAYNASEDAVGCLQIRQTMVDDINRILARQGKDIRYSYDCRWNREKSIEMFDIFCEYYGLDTAEEMARCWNGGPRGLDKPATEIYWNKVESELELYASS